MAHHAAAWGRRDVLELLSKTCTVVTDVSARNEHGETPLDIARRNEHSECQLLYPFIARRQELVRQCRAIVDPRAGGGGADDDYSERSRSGARKERDVAIRIERQLVSLSPSDVSSDDALSLADAQLREIRQLLLVDAAAPESEAGGGLTLPSAGAASSSLTVAASENQQNGAGGGRQNRRQKR